MLRRATRLVPRLGAAAAASAAAYNLSTALSESAPPELGAELASLSTDGEVVENWSGTHSASPSAYFQPETPAAVQRVVDLMGAARRRLRVVGSALSPNGMGLSDDGMLNMAFCAGVVSVDAERRQVTVQAGARVKEVVEALRPHGLTLQNYASIAEQQIGGFVQVGAHGTGAAVPPVDEQVVRLRLHTPALGALELSEASNPRLFRLAKVGLGALGVVSEVTLQCVPAHKLLQTTFVETRAGVQKRHAELLEHKHMRYMWIPHTDTVVVVTLDDAPDGMAPPPQPDEAAATKELRELLLAKDRGASAADAAAMNFAQLRDALIALDPLSKPHIIEVNRAEAAFWAKAGGQRIDWSDALLGFECGGQQWVSEVAFPCGTRAAPNGNDLAYMSELLEMVEASDLPAPAPIEQRWSARSRAPMSPAHSEGDDDIHSWVGIIMYLPDEATRGAITQRFWEYNGMCRERLWSKFGAHQHWAKIELPDDAAAAAAVRRRLAERFPVDAFNRARRTLDPHNILANDLVDSLLGDPREEAYAKRGG